MLIYRWVSEHLQPLWSEWSFACQWLRAVVFQRLSSQKKSYKVAVCAQVEIMRIDGVGLEARQQGSVRICWNLVAIEYSVFIFSMATLGI